MPNSKWNIEHGRPGCPRDKDGTSTWRCLPNGRFSTNRHGPRRIRDNTSGNPQMLALLHMGVQHETTSSGVRMPTATAGPIVQTPSQGTFSMEGHDGDGYRLDHWIPRRRLSQCAWKQHPDRLGCPDEDNDGWSDAGDAFPTDSTQWSDLYGRLW